MKRAFFWNFEAVVPILEFDFRVTVVALQAVRGYVLEKSPWPEHLSSDQRILANFLDLPIAEFLPLGSDFTPFENRYSSKITELTGFPSASKDFQADGKTFRDFAEHRLGTSLEGALYLCLKNFTTSCRVVIPSLNDNDADLDQLKGTLTSSDMEGISQAMDIILNPQLETGSKIIKMNPTVEQEFPNFRSILDSNSIGKTFGDTLYDAVYPVSVETVTA